MLVYTLAPMPLYLIIAYSLHNIITECGGALRDPVREIIKSMAMSTVEYPFYA